MKTEEVERDEEVEKVKRPTKRWRMSNEESFLLNEDRNNGNSDIEGLVEETMRSCFPPLMNELLNNGEVGGGPQPSELIERSGSIEMGKLGTRKWRKQRIMTLEVYFKRLELLQDQMKARLEDLQ